MPRPIEHKHALGPRELSKLAQVFEGACRDLAEESNARTAEQLELTRITLAQWIITCATRGVVDVENVLSSYICWKAEEDKWQLIRKWREN